MEIAVTCKALTKTFVTGSSQVMALRGVDLELNVGELFMLVGPSGCGKTTLISVIAGILNHDGGECIVFGKNLQSLSDRDRTDFRGKNLGFVFQSFNLVPTLTIAENVSIPLLLNGATLASALQKACEILAKVGLGDRTSATPFQLSGGQQQRVAIARALVHSPRLIVCDEPTSALDYDTGLQIMQLLRDVAVGTDRTLIIVSHDQRIFTFADRIGKLNDGRIEKVVKTAAEL